MNKRPIFVAILPELSALAAGVIAGCLFGMVVATWQWWMA